MRVGVTGPRDWQEHPIVGIVIGGYMLRAVELGEPFVLVHGAARGVDTAAAHCVLRARDALGTQLAEAMSVFIEPFPAPWEEMGPSAGPRRNRWMAREGRLDVVVGFYDHPLDRESGTADMLAVAQACGIEVVRVGLCRPAPKLFG